MKMEALNKKLILKIVDSLPFPDRLSLKLTCKSFDEMINLEKKEFYLQKAKMAMLDANLLVKNEDVFTRDIEISFDGDESKVTTTNYHFKNVRWYDLYPGCLKKKVTTFSDFMFYDSLVVEYVMFVTSPGRATKFTRRDIYKSGNKLTGVTKEEVLLE